MVNLWKKYDSKKTYDEYLNSDHKLRRQAVIISHILERHGIKKLNEIETVSYTHLTLPTILLV